MHLNGVLSGVPQGSILGSLLFILFINDMPLSCVSSEMGLFADDAKIYMDIIEQSGLHAT